jgi:energy-coupling factor transporter ATP-binding protein EcfA2
MVSLTAGTVEAEPTDFEHRLSTLADRINAQGKTGYNWSDVDNLLQRTFGAEIKTRCKKAGGSGRAANVLTESNDKDIDLYVVFVIAPYTIEQFIPVATDRIKRFPRVRTVAIADRSSGVWRVRDIVERDDVDLGERIRTSLPLVTEAHVHHVRGAESQRATDAIAEEVPAPDADVAVTGAMSYTSSSNAPEVLWQEYERHRAYLELEVDASTSVDALACFLSSQFIMLAGPSGTGKSSLARLMGRLFTSAEAFKVLEARRQWLGPEDAFGYYSPIRGDFATTPHTGSLIELHETTASALSMNSYAAQLPMLLVEEANLSPIEGYLAPFVHGLSSPSSPLITLELHSSKGGTKDPSGSLVIPENLHFGPFFRLLCTINVDFTAQAPAKKVTARAAVVLLEPKVDIGPASSAARLLARQESQHEDVPEVGSGAAWLGNPNTGTSLFSREALERQLSAVQHLVESVSGGREASVSISFRDVARIANYCGYYAWLARAVDHSLTEDETRSLAAENALMHFVLPNMPAEQFGALASGLVDSGRLRESKDATEVGGILRHRLDRLLRGAESGGVTGALDFWASLS